MNIGELRLQVAKLEVGGMEFLVELNELFVLMVHEASLQLSALSPQVVCDFLFILPGQDRAIL